mmetsp:Transcript_49763/g.115486  ORF Transcript_49763/g.115486 Transcript_49763/m.115486 type:complete len:242 (+) Transcript_49763:75-800(+)
MHRKKKEMQSHARALFSSPNAIHSARVRRPSMKRAAPTRLLGWNSRHNSTRAHSSSPTPAPPSKGNSRRKRVFSMTCGKDVQSECGNFPRKTSRTRQPRAQMSTFSVIFPRESKSSGAMYRGEPHSFSRRVMCVFSIDWVSPKSQSFTSKAKSNTTLSDLRSRCTNGGDCPCKNSMPSATWVETESFCASLRTFSFWCRRLYNEPFGMNSVTMQRFGGAKAMPMKWINRGCESAERLDTSL